MSDLTQLLKKLDIDDSSSTLQQVEHVSLQNLPQSLKPYLISLIKQDKYEVALRALQKYASEKTILNLVLEKAYIYYKLNKKSDFEQLLKKIDASELSNFELRGLDHIKAQFFYKYGDLEKAFTIYKSLIAGAQSGMDDLSELEVNKECTSQFEGAANFTEQEGIIYDLALNRSIAAATAGNYFSARQFAEQAASLAQEKEELLMAQFQLAYLNKNVKEKKDLLKKIASNRDNLLLQSLAKNNLQAIECSSFSTVLTNFPLVLSKMDLPAINVLKSSASFSTRQNSLISSNILLLRLFSNSSINENKSSLPIKYALEKYSELVQDMTMEPYSTQSKKLYHYVLKDVKNYKYDEEKHIALLLLAVQLQIQTKTYENAIRLVEEYIKTHEAFLKVHTFALLSIILLKLYKSMNRRSDRRNLLLKIQSYKPLEETLLPKANGYTEFWEYVAYEFLELGLSKKYTEVLTRASIPLPENSESDAPKFSFKCDVNKLIKLGVEPFVAKVKVVQNNKPGKILKKKPKKKSKKAPKRLPKSYDPARVPDPERWLPMKDRTSVMLKKSARKQRKLLAEGKTTQGGGLNNKKLARKLDISKKKTASATTASVKSSKSNKSGKSSKSKKKSGRK
ncbi:hypothetical protein ACO0RG_003245 [Hanseniaspora osmophila]